MTQFSQTNLNSRGIHASITDNLHGSGLPSHQSISRIHPEPAASTVRLSPPVPRM